MSNNTLGSTHTSTSRSFQFPSVGEGSCEIAAVIFDMDGTLLDTERVYFAASVSALVAMGYCDPEPLCKTMVAIPAPECEQLLVEALGPTFSLKAYRERFAVLVRDAHEQTLRLKPGAAELLESLAAASMPVAIATSSRRAGAEKKLAHAKLRAYIDILVTADDVKYTKPAPDPYIEVIKRLGIARERLIAIEDSNPGIESALRAGIRAIMVPDLVEPSTTTLASGAIILPDLYAVSKALFRS